MKKELNNNLNIFKGAGMNLKINIDKTRWIKTGIALILSNVFIYLVFTNEPKEEISQNGSVEIELRAELYTSYSSHKKVSVMNKQRTIKVDGRLVSYSSDPESKVLVEVDEADAYLLIKKDSWEVYPLLTNYKLSPPQRNHHEIRY
jgi:hypothetical protein